MQEIVCENCGNLFEMKLREEARRDGLDHVHNWSECPHCRQAYMLSEAEGQAARLERRQAEIAKRLESDGGPASGKRARTLKAELKENKKTMHRLAEDVNIEMEDYREE